MNQYVLNLFCIFSEPLSNFTHLDTQNWDSKSIQEDHVDF